MNPTSLLDWLAYLERIKSHNDPQSNFADCQALAQRLQIMHFQCPVISVVGTNGKGSCVTFLESVLQHAGYRVAAYTSPHLLKFNERIRFNSQVITDAMLVSVLSQVEQARSSENITFFAIITLAALLFFKQSQPDVIILEAGLGGRFDPINVIDNDIAIVTQIDFDHQQILGSTRDLIGFAKAGIMRAKRPVIIADPNPPQLLLDYGHAIKALMFQINKQYSYTLSNHWFNWQSQQRSFCNELLNNIHPQNLAAVLMTIELMQQYFTVTNAQIIKVLANFQIPGRFHQVSHEDCSIIADVAHNYAACANLARQLSERPIEGNNIAVLAMHGDKDYLACIQAMSPQIDYWCLADMPGDRPLSAKKLAEALNSLNVNQYLIHDTIAAAIDSAKIRAHKNDRIIVFGSFTTVEQIMRMTL